MAIRSDKAKNMKALKDELLKDPLQTEEKIAKKLGIARQSVNRLKGEMSEIVTNAKNDEIVRITDADREIIELAQYIAHSKLSRVKEQIVNGEIEGLEMGDVKKASEIAKESTARYSLFRGNATDEGGGLKTVAEILSEIQGLK